MRNAEYGVGRREHYDKPLKQGRDLLDSLGPALASRWSEHELKADLNDPPLPSGVF